MLQPKRTKFRKAQKGRMKGISGRGHQLSNGMFGIKSLDTSFITARQIEAARIAATRYMKREGHYGLRSFRISLLRRSLSRYVWVKVKVLQNISLQWFFQVESCSKLVVYLMILQKRLCVLQLRSYR